MTTTLLNSLHLFICVLLIILVLLQQGKGADAGAVFGGGGNTMFGAAGADNFLTKFTTVLAICFMLSSVFLGLRGQSGGDSNRVLDSLMATPGDSKIMTDSPEAAEIQKEIQTEIDKAKAAKKAGAVAESASETSASVVAEASKAPVSSNTEAAPKVEATPSAPEAEKAK